jgi:DNA-binding response OmpR family regulator
MESPSPSIERPETKVQERQGTILVVDDEYNIRSMMKEIMEMSGLKVFTAGNGQDGVDLYKRNRKDIDLIIMDMVMPIMDGREAFKEIRKLNPKQKIFIISGYSQREDMEDLLENGAVGFMRKPFQVREIVDKVNEILGSNN